LYALQKTVNPKLIQHPSRIQSINSGLTQQSYPHLYAQPLSLATI